MGTGRPATHSSTRPQENVRLTGQPGLSPPCQPAPHSSHRPSGWLASWPTSLAPMAYSSGTLIPKNTLSDHFPGLHCVPPAAEGLPTGRMDVFSTCSPPPTPLATRPVHLGSTLQAGTLSHKPPRTEGGGGRGQGHPVTHPTEHQEPL